jgi:hypothetical protein
MSETARTHTPGPWAVEQIEERAGRPDRWVVVSKHYSDEEPGICGDHSKHWALTEDDARLIAAAPDLLEACLGARSLVEELEAGGQPDVRRYGWGDTLRAAIAKAEGK